MKSSLHEGSRSSSEDEPLISDRVKNICITVIVCRHCASNYGNCVLLYAYANSMKMGSNVVFNCVLKIFPSVSGAAGTD